MTKIKIRSAIKEDGEQIAHLWMDVWYTNLKDLMPNGFLEQFSHEKQKEKYSQRALNANWILLVAENENKIVGMVGAKDSDLGLLAYPKEIKAMYVSPPYQRLGIGASLLNNIFTQLKQRGVDGAALWCIKSNLPACCFYEKHGGKKIENITPPAEYSVVPHIIYTWQFN